MIQLLSKMYNRMMDGQNITEALDRMLRVTVLYPVFAIQGGELQWNRIRTRIIRIRTRTAARIRTIRIRTRTTRTAADKA